MSTAPNPSTGPRTESGKAISSQNALKHGLASGTLIITGEDPAAFELLHHGFIKDLKPSGQMELALVEDMAKARWLKDRAIRFQGIAFEITMPHLENMAAPLDLSVLIRYQSANERAFFRAFKILQTLQKERLTAARQFVSQNSFHAPSKTPGTSPEGAFQPESRHSESSKHANAYPVPAK